MQTSFLVRFLIILFAGAEGQQSLQLAISCLISYTYNIKVINMKKMLTSFLLMVRTSIIIFSIQLINSHICFLSLKNMHENMHRLKKVTKKALK